MSSIKQGFRIWWQKPRKVTERDSERRVTFLELFYDLIFVVIISELAEPLSLDLTYSMLINFAFLFIIVWWSWLNGTAYYELHGNNDIRTRFYIFVQIIMISFMAVFAHDALTTGSVGFAVTYAIYQFILSWLWFRTGYHNPEHRSLSNPYSITFLIIGLMFLGSIFVDMPARFYIWGFGIILTLSLPFILRVVARRNQAMLEELRHGQLNTASSAERFALFTIIVLGEVIVGVVNGLKNQVTFDLSTLLTGLLGLLIAFGLWWLYFDSIALRIPKQTIFHTTFWVLFHLPLSFSIAAMGAILSYLINHQTQSILTQEGRFIIITTLIVTFISILALLRTIEIPLSQQRIIHTASIVLLAVTVVLIAVAGLNLELIPLLVVVNLLMFVPIVIGVRVWIAQQMDQATEQINL